MDAVKFIEECRRIYRVTGKHAPTLDEWTPVEDVVKEVEAWSDAHPRRTRQSVFLDQYPEAYVAKSTGLIDIQPCFIDKTLNPRGCVKKCVDCNREFWMQEVE